ncbi:carbohydrate ABC transporter permease [Microbacterium yannicii]|uniref:carbohydrate ABC transporter permease n=1 Tax=Microbacterium yannicii TaxID=671622 RepID=UPI001887E066|nr:sugar ABC transporter permease [Microbacterium yannicii]MCO5954432.1 sugar ABC transporter permease [Microbacterium yannicii]
MSTFRTTTAATFGSTTAAPGLERVRATRGRRPRSHSVGRSLWWFVLPALAVYLYVVLVPTVQGAAYSFTDWSSSSLDKTFIGWENYIEIFKGDAGPATIRTLFIAFVTVVAQNVIGLGLALLLNGAIRGRNVLRTIIFAPLVVSALVVGYLFKYIFGPPDIGGINTVLAALGMEQVDFLGNPTIALWIIIVTIIWQFTGSTMVIYLAGLQGVPAELLEAASLDGAGFWQRFWFIMRPLLAPAITINLMLGLIGGLKIFDQIFSLTGGGPAGQTQTISTLIYQLFSQFGQYGKSAALAMVLAVAVAILAFVQFSVLRRQEQYS